MAHRLRRSRALHARLAGGDHRRAGGEAERIGREFAQNAEDSGGRSMIILGAGTNHWFHSDTIYRTFLAMITLTGCQGVNGGGWAHYVGQEKARPITGWANLAFALDWQRPARQMIGTAFWYVNTDQWRYDNLGADLLATPLGEGPVRGRSDDRHAGPVGALGWMPSFPDFDRNPLDLADEAEAAGGRRGVHQAAVAVRRPEVRDRGPRCARELASRAHDLAGQPVGLVE
ncbi:MAG: molybdopterin-dependent oxidoreductase [Micrococcales bacterium]|nr:molybdopterin-dependent oxidoreductase [Micrococcales bacterium]